MEVKSRDRSDREARTASLYRFISGPLRATPFHSRQTVPTVTASSHLQGRSLESRLDSPGRLKCGPEAHAETREYLEGMRFRTLVRDGRRPRSKKRDGGRNWGKRRPPTLSLR